LVGAWVIASAAWLAALQAIALGFRLPGLLVLPRHSPRRLWVASAAAAVALLVAAAAIGATPAAVGLAFPAGVLLSLLLPGLRPLSPDRAFLPGSAAENWRSQPFELSDQPGAGALLLSPKDARASSTSACIIVIHGGGNDRLYGLWHALSALLNRGFLVLAANLPGHGRSGTDPLSLGSARHRLDALVNAARKRHPGRAIVLLGQSIGGSLALDALARGTQVDAAVAVSAPASLEQLGSVWGELAMFIRPTIYHSLRYGTLFELLPAFGRFRRSDFPVRVPKGRSYTEVLRELVRALELPARLRMRPTSSPVLLVQGARDTIVPAGQAIALREALGDSAMLLLAPGIHHLDPLFEDQLVNRIVDWIASASTPGTEAR
jgi:pimeloyl-ACP methyl ester carboxylesterase